MDFNVDPCDNFYQFACGGFLNKTIIPEAKVVINRYEDIRDVILERLNKTLAEKSTNELEIKPFKLAKIMYNACMNRPHDEKGNLVGEDFAAKYGAWPLQTRDWNETIAWKQEFFKNNSQTFFVHYIFPDQKNNSRTILQIPRYIPIDYPANSTIDLESIVKSEIFKTAVYLSKYLTPNKSISKKDILDVFELHHDLTKMPSTMKDIYSEQYHLITFDELSKSYPNIPWKAYFNEKLLNVTTIQSDDLIDIGHPEYIAAIDNMLKETSSRVLANYVKWRAIAIEYFRVPVASKEKMKSMTRDSLTRSNRWKHCTESVRQSMPYYTAALYVKKYFVKEIKEDVQNIYLMIRNKFKNILQKVVWMDRKTRRAAIEKLENINAIIAHSDELIDDLLLETSFGDVEIKSDDFLTILETLSKRTERKKIEGLRRTVNTSDKLQIFNDMVATVNAYYMPQYNSIVVPAAILQGEFYSDTRPKYMNYGAIGFIIGHELVHAFDVRGSQRDKNGHLNDWWDQNSCKNNVRSLVKCFINQYSQYYVSALNRTVDGTRTIGEDIADNGGTKAAYLAYKQWAKVNGPEPRLPGLNFTPKQLFWISLARSKCAAQDPDYTKYLMRTGPHTLSEFRVIGILSNSPEFSKDFECPAGSPMNPEKKCIMW